MTISTGDHGLVFAGRADFDERCARLLHRQHILVRILDGAGTYYLMTFIS